MDEPTETHPQHRTATEEWPCVCGSHDHQPVRIGEALSPTGSIVGPVYVCPAPRATSTGSAP
ncbi:hypothetical protein [Streptomyces prasinopilosus]|uniref:hypothetical protein n=1 Tax=Streptomyces prasinopilosus TaxID=67344 RepID=UPI000B14BE8A|nr:hypothetical protein [Streptomyces prasinopilosus]